MLEQVIQENTQVMRELMAVFRTVTAETAAAVAYRQQKAVELESTPTTAANDADATPPTEPSAVDWAAGLRKELSTTVLAIAKNHDRQSAVKLLARFGAAKVTEVTDEQLADALAAAEELLGTLNATSQVEDAG